MILRARTLWTGTAAPVDDGALSVEAGRIEAVGRFREVAKRGRGAIVDLGDAVLLPGLVNAHCHLDYTGMGGLIPPTQSFTDWIKAITGLKGAWGYSEFAESWCKGAAMLVRTGTTTVGDIEAVPELPADLWAYTPLRMISFFEMTGVRSRRDPSAILLETLSEASQLPRQPRKSVGLSPHALYSTMPALIRMSAELAREENLLLAIHAAESDEEYRMFAEAEGPMYQWLRRNDRDMGDCGDRSPIQQLARLGALGPNLLAIHVNYLRDGDADRLAQSRCSVVHCPRSHAYFRHLPFPFVQLNEAGVNICLGTDSLATVRAYGRESVQLNMFLEMRNFAAQYPACPPQHILAMATSHGARALGLGEEVGRLTPGFDADVIAVPARVAPEQAAEAVIHHVGPVRASMIAGQWAWPPS